jgi:hypothetical protein
MTFNQGQRVRIRGKQFVGTVEKKLASLNNVYIVMIENASPNPASPNHDKLVRGEDLEVIAEWTA